MGKQDVIRRLSDYRAAGAEMETLWEEYRRLESKLTSPSKPSLDGMPRSNYAADRMANNAIKLADMSRRIESMIAPLEALRLAIEAEIAGLEPLERAVLRCRYILGQRWQEVAAAVSYSVRQCQRVHDAAIEKMSHNVALEGAKMVL